MREWFLICFLSLLLVNCSPFQFEESNTMLQSSRGPADIGLESRSVHSTSSVDYFLDDKNEAVNRWIKYYQGKGKGHMTYALQRSTKYLPMMTSVFRQHKIPEDLVYVALVESGFTSQAVSTASAVGYWQFIATTGRHYGLQIDNKVDERFDAFDSTEAAARYLKDLYATFESWHLALAAYNAGESRVSRAVLNNKNRNFWTLSEKQKIPAETRSYIPKIIATIKIAKNPEEYGFHDLNYAAPLKYDKVILEANVSLRTLASDLKVDYGVIKKLNPKYKTDEALLDKDGEVTIRVPKGTY